MGVYHLDRFNGQVWTTLVVSPEPVGPGDLNTNPAFLNDPKRPGLCGVDGEPYKARVRYVDVTTDIELELYDWAKVPMNPNDPDSDTVWGWKCIKCATKPSEGRGIQKMRVGVPW